MVRILVVEDDPSILKLLSGDLELEGYSVLEATNGALGLERARSERPDLVILDVALPKMNGYDVCRALRTEGSDIPIIMLTARIQEAEKVLGLNQGADDYVTKPYGSMELMARVKALLRRHKRELDKVEKATFDGITVDFRRMEASRKGKPIELTTKEFQVLELLIRYRGEVVTRRQFLEQVWGFDEMPTTRTVDNRLTLLRQKLAPRNSEAYIVTVHGMGYKFVGTLES